MVKKLENSHILLNQRLLKEYGDVGLGKWSSCLGPPHGGEGFCTPSTLQQPHVELGQGS